MKLDELLQSPETQWNYTKTGEVLCDQNGKIIAEVRTLFGGNCAAIAGGRAIGKYINIGSAKNAVEATIANTPYAY